MYADIVFPQDNEEEFVDIAVRLGYGAIFFIYKIKEIDAIKKRLSRLQERAKIKIYYGILASHNTIQKAKKLGKLILVRSSNKNRAAIEKNKGFVLYDLEENSKRDYIHQRASGLNQILCKIANKNNVKMGFSLHSIKQSGNKTRLMGRIKQNIKLCRKYKVDTVIGSFATKPYEMRSPKDLMSLFVVLGMHYKEAEESI